MGYFSNGSEGHDYQERYCWRCVHWNRDFGCPAWQIHQVINYDECNKKDSVLHQMIPRLEDGTNGKCFAFIERKEKP